MPSSTLVFTAGALFSSDGKLLLLRRTDGAWELPCGELEFGEEPEHGVARALLELTGVEVSADRPLGGWSAVDAGTHSVFIGYTVTLSGTLLAVELDPEHHTAFCWIEQKEVAAKLDSPPLRRACERAFSVLARSRKNRA